MKFTSLKSKGLYLFIILVSFWSCIEKTKIPDNVLNKEEMAKCMSRLLVAEDITRNKGFQKDSSTTLFLNHYKPQELKKLGYTVEQFDSSYNFYVQHAEMLQDIMTIAKTDLEKQITDYKNKPKH